LEKEGCPVELKAKEPGFSSHAPKQGGNAMDTVALAGLTLLLAWLLGISLLTLFHELGHALTALVLSHQPIQIFLGTTPHQMKQRERLEEPTFCLGRLAFYLSLSGLPFGIGWARWPASLSWRHSILALLAGPVTTFLCLIVLSLTMLLLKPAAHPSTIQRAVYDFLLWLLLLTCLLLLACALPVRYPSWWPGALAGVGSDGYKIRTLLKQRKQHKRNSLQDGNNNS
jgi:hypothetical protein